MNTAVPVGAERAGALLAAHQSVLVAFSGGVDSSVLLALALRACGRERVLAVTIASPFIPAAEVTAARALAARLDARHEVLPADPLSLPQLRDNPADRCYHCKKMLYSALLALARARGLAAVVDGSNADDSRDYRPGSRARQELGISAPLQEAGMTKAEVRATARALGLPNAEAPALACLATRFPAGTTLTPEGLARVAQAEAAVRALGFAAVRVRVHGDLARLEVPPADLPAAAGRAAELAAAVHTAGYRYAALDLDGYRTGSMNG